MQKHFAVIGHPIGHTMSPFLHKKMFSLRKIDATYEALPIPPEELKASIPLLKTYDGFNVTIPHKESVLKFMSQLGESATLYRAVNTVVNRDGLFIGHSTDAEGFTAALELEDIPLKGSVLICGSGGVSRTMATECLRAGCKVTFAVRPTSLPKAGLLAEELGKRFNTVVCCLSLLDITGEYDLAINGTSVGMHPHSDATVLTENQLKKISYVFDAVYNPENTKLVDLARKVGVKKAISGMGMLVLQAAKSEEHWLGVTFTKQEILELISQANAEMRRIFL